MNVDKDYWFAHAICPPAEPESMSEYQRMIWRAGVHPEACTTIITPTPPMEQMLREMEPRWRDRWCEAYKVGGCSCLGCANVAGGLERHGYTKADWDKRR